MTLDRKPIICMDCGSVYTGRKIHGKWQIWGASKCRQCGETEFKPVRYRS